MSDWIILRTSGRHTLPLVRSLDNAGFCAWTPSIQLGKPKSEQFAPVLPTYAFARTVHLMDLMRISADPMSQHPGFSVFHYLGAIPLVADCELEPLRQLEERDRFNAKRRKPKMRKFEPGENVTPDDGAWCGLSGIVEHDNGKFVMVLFGNRSVKIATFLLQGDLRAAA